jgi:hypothetical protein
MCIQDWFISPHCPPPPPGDPPPPAPPPPPLPAWSPGTSLLSSPHSWRPLGPGKDSVPGVGEAKGSEIARHLGGEAGAERKSPKFQEGPRVTPLGRGRKEAGDGEEELRWCERQEKKLRHRKIGKGRKTDEDRK